METAEGNSLAGKAYLIVAKHRNGATAEIQMKFIKEQVRFENDDEADGFGLGIGMPRTPPDPSSFSTVTKPSKMNDDQAGLDDFDVPF
jgi:replicative DNA helicase